MSTTTQAIIANINHARNRLADLSMKVQDIELMLEIAKINATLNDTIYNLKSAGHLN